MKKSREPRDFLNRLPVFPLALPPGWCFVIQVMTLKPDTRWKQRLENFDRAYALLREALDEGPGALNAL
ncbi:MAG: hypothetical protein U1F77_15900, partial [Kiritimatiellia bacterium]